jgi:hypothetical protein
MNLLGRAGICCLAISLPAATASATLMAGSSDIGLRQAVYAADYIVAGTVSSMEGASDSNVVFTRVTLSNLVIAKGQWPIDSMTIQIIGGNWRGSRVVLVGSPRLERGWRYVLCLRESLGTARDHYQPLVYGDQGLFPVLEDSSKQIRVVHDGDYRPVVDIEDGNLVVMEWPAWPPQMRQRYERNMAREPSRGEAKRWVVADKKAGIIRIVIPEELDPGTRIDETAFLKSVDELLKAAASLSAPAAPSGTSR